MHDLLGSRARQVSFALAHVFELMNYPLNNAMRPTGTNAMQNIAVRRGKITMKEVYQGRW